MSQLPPFEYESVPDFNTEEFTRYTSIRSLERDKPHSKHECSRCEIRELRHGQRDRILVCSCFGGTYLSSTVRRLAGRGDIPFPRPRARRQLSSGFLDPKAERKNRLNTPNEIGELLRRVIFGPQDTLDQRAEGLIVVAGSTNSGKSTIVRALIHHYLAARLRSFLKISKGGKLPRRPHLITIEDPIETYFAGPNDWRRTGIDYTPREIGTDVMNLTDAIYDALRQTPDAFYVGEIRNSKDWPALLELAGSGHLAITTTHAGTLTEAMRNIFQSMNARTPAARSAIAARIKAVVHLRSDDLPKDARSRRGGPTVMQVPVIWRGRSGAIALMEYGLSSVLPSNPPSMNDSIPVEGCLGRVWFADQLVNTYCVEQRETVERFRSVRETAAGWDLRGV